MRTLRMVGSALLMFVGGIVGGALVQNGAIHAQGSPQGRKQPWTVRPDGTVVFRSILIGNERGKRIELRDGDLFGFTEINNQTIAMRPSTPPIKGNPGGGFLDLAYNVSSEQAKEIFLGPDSITFFDFNNVLGGSRISPTGLSVTDDSGRDRVVIGPVSTVYKQSGVSTNSSIGTITIFDDKGDVVWQMPHS